jgi:hypothetical protein
MEDTPDLALFHELMPDDGRHAGGKLYQTNVLTFDFLSISAYPGQWPTCRQSASP